MHIQTVQKNQLPVTFVPNLPGLQVARNLRGLGLGSASFTSQVTDVLNVGVKAYTELAARKAAQQSALLEAKAQRQAIKLEQKAALAAKESKDTTTRYLIIGGVAVVAVLALGAMVVRSRRRGK